MDQKELIIVTKKKRYAKICRICKQNGHMAKTCKKTNISKPTIEKIKHIEIIPKRKEIPMEKPLEDLTLFFKFKFGLKFFK